jgi:hypothetical protein
MKMFLSFFVSAIVLLASMYVPRIDAGAIATHIVIVQVQAGGAGAATQEYVVLYNNGDAEVDVTNWCLTNKNGVKIYCFVNSTGEKTFVPGKSYATVVSAPYAASHTGHFPAQFLPVSQSSGSITSGNDTIALIDAAAGEVDKLSWSSTLSGGSQYARKMSDAMDVLTYVDTDTLGDWAVIITTKIPEDETRREQFDVDVCSNIAGIQSAVPDGMFLESSDTCVERQEYELFITEVLPNAIGADTGNEFLEIYNPNDVRVSLSEFLLKVGPELSDAFTFPVGSVIEPGAYAYFSNTEIKFNLLNTSSRVSMLRSDGTVVSEMPAYEDPEEGESWALDEGVWQYTTTPTPGNENILTVRVLAPVLLQSCAPNQYRSLETNRCRLLETATKTQTPCKVGQYRNEETGRCRTIASDAKTVAPCGPGQIRNLETNRCRKEATGTTQTPCKPGQERHLETNRCRNVTKMTNAGYGVLGSEKKNDGNVYVLATVAGILLLAVAYAVWEWREEIAQAARKVRVRALQFARLSK